jgi:hypothetical protein
MARPPLTPAQTKHPRIEYTHAIPRHPKTGQDVRLIETLLSLAQSNSQPRIKK